jgi:hypothetical protein
MNYAKSNSPAVAESTTQAGTAPVEGQSPKAASSQQPAENKKERTFVQRLQKFSLMISGALNAVGDVLLMRTGYKDFFIKKQKGAGFEFGAGVLYTLGAINLTAFGAKPVTRSMEDLAEGTKDHLQGVKKAQTLSQSLRNYAARNTLALYTMGAISYLIYGVIRRQRDKTNWEGVAYATSSLTIKALSLLVPEREPGAEPKTIKGDGIFAWFADQPLRIFGIGNFISDGLLLRKAIKKNRRGEFDSQKDYYLDLGVGASYMVSDLFSAISKKNAVDEVLDEQAADQLAQRVADHIENQPDESKEALVEQAATYLEKQPELGRSKNGLRDLINKKLADRSNNSNSPPEWSEKIHQTPSAMQLA